MRYGMRKTIDLKAAAARSAAPEQVRELTFKELCDAYIAVVFDGADLRTRKWIDAFGTLSAWRLEQSGMLERCMEAMAKRAADQHHQPRYQPNRLDLQMGGAQAHDCPAWLPERPRQASNGSRKACASSTCQTSEMERPDRGSGSLPRPPFSGYLTCCATRAPHLRKFCFAAGETSISTLARYWCRVTKDRPPAGTFFTPGHGRTHAPGSPKRDAGALLFEGRGAGCPITFRRSWRELSKAIGRPDLRQHDMRHHVAQRLLKGRVTIAVATQILGHSSNILQKRYGHLETQTLQEAALSTLSPTP